MGKQSADQIEIEVSGSNVEITASTVSVNCSNETAKTNREQTHRVHLQNRRCGVFACEVLMPDGKTTRILQILDSPVDFSSHPNFISGLNNFRNQCFGEKGRLYVTKDVPIPVENPEIVVYFAFVHTKTGAISGEKVFTKDEARASLTKMRDEIQKWRERRREAFQKAPAEFGSELGAAIRNAQEQKTEEKIASN